MSILLSLEAVSVQNQGKTILDHIHFTLQEGQQWVLVGASGAGKSALLSLIAGKLRPSSGSYKAPFAQPYLQAHQGDGSNRSFHDLIALTTPQHSFKSKSNVQNFYYQQRFNSSELDDIDTVEEYLVKYAKNSWNNFWTLDKVIQTLDLSSLKDKKIIMLSNGESRRLTFALALLKNPSILLMDQPLIGLDRETRERFDDILQQIIQSGIHLILATSATEIPDSITHVAWLQDGRIHAQGKKESIALTPLVLANNQESTLKKEALLREELSKQKLPTFERIVEMKDVHISYGDKQVLSGINWTVKQGEHWVVQGHNGAGKSTLLSLINGDNPQAYANHIVLFDRKRGSGESIWDIKKKIGYVSPEQHQYFPVDQSCLSVILSGYYDTDGLFRKVSEERQAQALRWMQVFEIDQLKHRLLKMVTTGEQRLCLLARALIKTPPLLILDEPCQGLSSVQRDRFKAIITHICQETNTTIIYVSHYPEDIPDSIDKKLVLSSGKIVLIKG
ncbi:ATP-binding cassette domain-containing protein [Olivibacter sitiensis]|uniref:ATP-binding cassette domain-containing protein n=1 Tax=Olivibacter sitiensis TaxID=376470 RepID=UPI000411D440|nr:ATP-binding cassette domain-containing protein [Olivibacter sitiensis]